MELVKLDISKAGVEISADMKKQTMEANALLHSGKGAGNDFLGVGTPPHPSDSPEARRSPPIRGPASRQAARQGPT